MRESIRSAMLLGILSGCAVGWPVCRAEAETIVSPPNVLIFLMDDMGIGDTRVYDEHCKVELPHVEQLAREGMVFTDAHSPAAVCAPTRYSILTGNFPWRGREPNGTWTVQRPSQIRPGQKTLADMLGRQGYDTAFFGKEHLGGGLIEAATGKVFQKWKYTPDEVDFSQPMPEGLQTKGFDYVYSLPQGIQGPPYAYFENGRLLGNPAEIITWEKGTYGRSAVKATGWGMPDWDSSAVGPNLTHHALEFLDRHYAAQSAGGSRKPFLLYYSSQSCHTPHTPPEELGGVKIDGASGHSPHLDIIFEGNVTLGLLMDRIRAAGELDNTLIIFTSDNGGLCWSQRQEGDTSHNSSGNLKGGKGQVWEGGHRVPLIVRWGDGTDASPVPPGVRSDALIGLQDLYATLAELTGHALARNEALDSFSFLGVLQNREAGHQRDELLIQSNNEPEWGQSSTRAFRVGSWKLVVTKDHAPRNLFNLAEDPGERKDLVKEPDQADRIAAMLKAYNRTIRSDRSVPLADL
ncbi:MAG: arylsulfatase [Verrucomicrobia bacterium]|nr:arylsulfatase [Kiritimatiellia bacterium]MCP5488143.1 arylsulfatase [Verrucomicrobiota bacterium]